MSRGEDDPLFDRELSWLSFNHRVLQEAADERVPLLERLKFLAIYSSNLDEFFRVRVASLRSLLRLGRGSRKRLDFNPAKVLKRIHRIVVEQQELFGRIFGGEILPALRREGIHLYDQGYTGLPATDTLRESFYTLVLPCLHPQILDPDGDPPFLENGGLYLVAELWPLEDGSSVTLQDARYGIVEIPSREVARFLVLDGEQGHHVAFLDDVVRTFLDAVFPEFDVGSAYSIKMTRDAELYVDEDDFEGSLVEAIEKSLKKRETGAPTRLLFDPRTPYRMITALRRAFDLDEDDLVVGGVYHNFSDFFSFPDFGREDLKYEPQEALPHPAFSGQAIIWDVISGADHLLHVPYQSFQPVVDLFEAAADDPTVEEVFATLYRVGSQSRIVEALIRAAENGKRVTVFVEVKARFDEAPNIDWARRMEDAGVKVIYSRPKVKVHAKLLLVGRREEEITWYAYLGTGNFNEKTARTYSDLGLFTADTRLTREVRDVFRMLEDPAADVRFEHLLVAPNGLRQGISRGIKREVSHATEGRPAGLTLKMNSLEDPKVIRRLYDASRKGVPIRMVIRGICRLVPGVEGLSEGIVVTSILDRYLEHVRLYRFENGGDPVYYLASADLMRRNLDHRVEVAFPILDERLKQSIDAILQIQTQDTERARIIDEKQRNRRAEGSDGFRAQMETYRLLEALSAKG